MTLRMDGTVLHAGAAAKTVVGPLKVSVGRHTLAADPQGGGTSVEATVTVRAGSSTDIVLHRQADPTKAPVFTAYANDLSPVTAGSARLTVAHTAAVGPADIRVKGEVLFANVANGEQLTLTVPGGTYPVDIVPTATTGPVVFGPVNLPVAKSTLTRVFAIGVAATSSMDAVVQVLPISTRGSGAVVGRVEAGDGGQAQALIAAHNRADDDATTASSTPAFALPLTFVSTLVVLLAVGAVARAGRAARARATVSATRRRRTRHT